VGSVGGKLGQLDYHCLLVYLMGTYSLPSRQLTVIGAGQSSQESASSGTTTECSTTRKSLTTGRASWTVDGMMSGGDGGGVNVVGAEEVAMDDSGGGGDGSRSSSNSSSAGGGSGENACSYSAELDYRQRLSQIQSLLPPFFGTGSGGWLVQCGPHHPIEHPLLQHMPRV